MNATVDSPTTVETSETQSDTLDVGKLMRLRAALEASRTAMREEGDSEVSRLVAESHDQITSEIRRSVPAELDEELGAWFDRPEHAAPSRVELRISHAMLSGWLDGFFQSLQLSALSSAAKQALRSATTVPAVPPRASDGARAGYV